MKKMFNQIINKRHENTQWVAEGRVFENGANL